MNGKYPYLGVNQFEDKSYVVLFTEPEYGIIVMSESDNDKLKFGVIGNFDESKFDDLPKDQCVKLNN